MLFCLLLSLVVGCLWCVASLWSLRWERQGGKVGCATLILEGGYVRQ